MFNNNNKYPWTKQNSESLIISKINPNWAQSTSHKMFGALYSRLG